MKLRKREDVVVHYDVVNDELTILDIKTKKRYVFTTDVLLDKLLNINLKRTEYEE